MPTKEYHFKEIEKEFATARDAIMVGNDGKARVCARRAAGQAITWFMSKYPRPAWRSDALNQLQHLTNDQTFPHEARDAAIRLTTKISDKFAYPFSTDPIEDATIIIKAIVTLMDSYAA